MAVFLVPDKKVILNGVTVKHYFLNEHNVNKISLPSKMVGAPIGVTLHNTDRIVPSKGTTCAEQYTRATVNGNMRSVRVHLYVDDAEAWQNLPFDWQSWHAGHTGRSDAHGSEAGNAQTISIECIMNGSGDEKDIKARDNAARLAAYLLDTYGGELYTHNYWENIRNGWKGSIDELNKRNDGYKGCPVYIRPKWDEFKALVGKYRKGAAADDSSAFYRIQLGAYRNIKNAEAKLEEVRKHFPEAFIKEGK